MHCNVMWRQGTLAVLSVAVVVEALLCLGCCSEGRAAGVWVTVAAVVVDSVLVWLCLHVCVDCGCLFLLLCLKSML